MQSAWLDLDHDVNVGFYRRHPSQGRYNYTRARSIFMVGAGDGGALSAAQQVDLQKRLGRFRAEWKSSAPAGFDRFLPPAGADHRRPVLIELIRADMNLRAAAGLGVDLNGYISRFAEDLPGNAIPASLLAEEFFLRQQGGANPAPEAYRTRYPDQYKSFLTLIGAGTPPEVAEKPGPAATLVFDPPEPKPNAIPTREQVEPSGSRLASTHAPVNFTINDSRPPESKSVEVGVGGSSHALEYKLLKLLGRGMFGEVFEAIAPGGFRVAVKKMLRHVDHPATKQELSALESIKAVSHPFLLQTHAFWITEGHVTIVMELADGTLSDRIKEFKQAGKPGVPVEELVPYFEQASEALDYLHSQNVSHRDVKPQNLLYHKGYCKVADFGLVHVHQSSQTTVGNTSGTPAYMPPEVWDGKVSLHSDQYSLACAYVAARLGRNVFDGQAMYVLAQQHKLDTPKLDELPEAERNVVLRALAKKPSDRFPNCKLFSKALREAVFPVPVSTSQSVLILPPQDPPSLLSRIVPAVVTAGICIAGVFLLLQYRGVWDSPTPPPAPTEPAPPPPPWCPTGWTAVADAGIGKLEDGTRYHKQLSRDVAGDTLVALAIPRTPGVGPQTPVVFYMLRDKVTNKQFTAVWDAAEADPGSMLNRARRNLEDKAGRYLPGTWRAGATSLMPGTAGNRLGITGAQAEVPVIGVTMIEAAVAAASLNGQLPTYDQWMKATGRWEPGDIRISSAGDPSKLDLGPAPPRTEGLALNLQNGPWPVTKATPDISIFGVHELISNGFEWTRQTPQDTLVNVLDLPRFDPNVYVGGMAAELDTVLTFSRIADQPAIYPIDSAKSEIGFRIVLQP